MPAGRPPKEFDKKVFADLVSIGCEEDEICWFFRDADGKPANSKTLSKWCERTYGVNFYEYKKQNGRMRVKIEVRKAQLELAKKNPSMAIWLGKQYLGQKEQPDNEDPELLNRAKELLGGINSAID